MKKNTKKIERVFLLFPPVRMFRENPQQLLSPLGVSYIASVIRNDVDVKIMDALIEDVNNKVDLDKDFVRYGASYKDILAQIEAYKPDIVGISCLWSTVAPVLRELTREIKRLDKDILIITGGSYPTFMVDQCMLEMPVDMIALGEGEITMLECIRHLRDGRALVDVDGLAYREGERIVVNQKKNWIENLDCMPFPARDLLPMDLYRRYGVPHSITASSQNTAPIVTSRGCPARCIYCSSTSFWGNHYRFRSSENVLDEIGELVNRWSIEELQFEDDNMTANRSRAKAIFQGIIDRGYKIKFNFPNGIALWTLDEEMIDLMANAGCYEMSLPFESGCQKVLREIVKKPTDLKKAREIAKIIKAKGIRTTGFYIIGFPGETKEQMMETFRFADEVKTDIGYFFVANPLPGTELYKIAQERNMLRDDFGFENNTYTRSAYNYSVYPKGELERLVSHQFVKYSIRSFLRNPRVILKVFFFDLLFKHPRKTLGLLARVLKRYAPSIN
jgi:magnesium-protoporphyrin IX monomethyl ester (oxidative) cyclase